MYQFGRGKHALRTGAERKLKRDHGRSMAAARSAAAIDT
jgi:hypothetical protein